MKSLAFVFITLLSLGFTLKSISASVESILGSVNDEVTKKFLSDNCFSFVELKRNVGTTSPSIEYELKCKNIDVDTIVVTKCATCCVIPTTCELMKRLENKPITVRVERKHRNDENVISLHLPIACKCVVWNKNYKSDCSRFTMSSVS